MVAALVNAAAFAALAAATTATAAVFTSYLNLSALASGVPALPRLPPAAGLAPALPSAPPPAGPSLQQAPYLQWSLVLLSAQLVDRELAELPPRTLLEAGAEREEGEEEMKEEVAEEEEAAVGREAGKAAIRRRLPHALRCVCVGGAAAGCLQGLCRWDPGWAHLQWVGITGWLCTQHRIAACLLP